MIPCALAFAAGLAFSLSHRVPLAPSGSIFAALAVALAFLLRRRVDRLGAAALVAAFTLAGFVRGGAEILTADRRERAASAVPEGRVTLEGAIVSFPEAAAADVEFVLAAERIEAPGKLVRARPPIRVRVRATLPAAGARYGARVRMTGEIRRPAGIRNPGGYDEAARARQTGIDLVARGPGFRVEEIAGPPGKDPVRTSLATLRADLLRGSDAWFEGRARGTYGALVLGERRRILPEDSASLRNAGLIHILAISGMHVVIVAGFAMTALSLVRLAPNVRSFVLALFLLVYGFIAGFGPPVARATLAAEIVLLGKMIDRRAPAMRHLAATALVLLAWHPFDLLDAGFQLSYAATAGLITASPWLRGSHGRFVRWIGGPLLLSTAAQEFVLPILARQFGCVPVAGPLANLAALPVAGAIVPAGLLVVVAETTAAPLAALFAGTFWVLERGLFAVAYLTERTAGPPLPVPPPFFALAVAHTAALVLVFRSKGKTRLAAGSAAVLTTTFFLAGMPHGRGDLLLRATFLDVGQGDACVLEAPGWGAMLVDGADADERYDAGEARIVPFLRRSGIRRIKAAVVTHPHKDHYGGMPAVLRASRVDSLWLSSARGPLEEGYVALIASSDSLRIGRRALVAGETIALGSSVRARVLHPPKDHAAKDVNDMSLVLAVEAGETEILLTGDAGIAAESLLVASNAIGAVEVLKVGHHGSNTSSSATFLQAAHPSLAIVPVGRNNRYALPKASVLDALSKEGAVICRTDSTGAVIVEVRRSGGRWRRVGEREWHRLLAPSPAGPRLVAPPPL